MSNSGTLCRCGCDIHPSALTERVSRMWRSHHFPEDYDPDTDDSPIVCPGSYTEGPLPAPKPTSAWIVGENTPWQKNLLQEMLYGWSFSEPAKLTFKTWLPGDELKTWYDVGYLSEPIAVKAAKGLLPAWNYQKTAWTTYDKSAAEKAHKAISKMAATVQNLTCEKSDTVIEFGPKNWPVEPKPAWTFWQPWHNCVPSVYNHCWRETIKLPTFPKPDWKAIGDQINSKQFSFNEFNKPVGVK